MPNRPSPKELTKKLRAALDLLRTSGYQPVDAARVAKGFYGLDLFTEEEILAGLT